MIFKKNYLWMIVLNVIGSIVIECSKKINLDKEADLFKLLDQWKTEDDLPDDDVELSTPAPIDFNQLNSDNPEDFLQLSKKGKTLMTFVNVNGSPTREETDSITKVWQSGLHNNHILLERYVIADDRVIFLFKDGSQAWQAKDYLVKQERCKSVTIENKVYDNLATQSPQRSEL